MSRSMSFARAPLARVLVACAALVASVAGCDRASPVAPERAPTAPRTSLLGGVLGTVPQLLGCPSDESQSASAVIGPEGGSLVSGGFRVDFPAGAVDSARTFTLSVPASRYLEIEVHADGFEHYVFATPVTVTLDASRCGVLPLGLQVWNIDTETKALLEPMGGSLDLLTRTVRFRTPHFSGYTIAW